MRIENDTIFESMEEMDFQKSKIKKKVDFIKFKNLEKICKNSDIFGGDLFKLSNTTLRKIIEDLENVKSN